MMEERVKVSSRVVKVKIRLCTRRRPSFGAVSKCRDTAGMVEAGLFIWNLLSPVHPPLLSRIPELGVEAPWTSALTKLAPRPTSDLTFPHHAVAVLSWS